MSANVNILERPEVVTISVRESTPSTWADPVEKTAPQKVGWKPEDFETAQLLGLVRQVFLFDRDRSSRHIVFSAADADTDISSLCMQVARTLASETTERVALLEHPRDGDPDPGGPVAIRTIKNRPSQVADNLWRISPEEFANPAGKATARADWHLSLARLRDEYAYGVIQGPALGGLGQAAFLGQLSDGIVLVLSAYSTRKAVARNIKQALQGMRCPILGTVLSRRTFPIPERIYRWL